MLTLFPDVFDNLNSFSIIKKAIDSKKVEIKSHNLREFADNSRKGFEAAAKAAGGGVWLFVAGLVILVIFRVFSVYVGMIQDAASKI